MEDKQIKKLEDSVLKLQEQIEQLKNEKPKFEEGWYWSDNDKDGWLVYYEDEISHPKYGFDWDNDWSSGLTGEYDSGCVKATDKEVEEALIKEAKKRGFKEGAYVDWSTHYMKDKPSKMNSSKLCCQLEKGDRFGLRMGGGVIYANGKWAEIIDTTLEINGYKMEQDGDIIKFGCAKFHKFDLRFWHKILKHKTSKSTDRYIKSITLDSDVTITVKELQQIVDNIK